MIRTRKIFFIAANPLDQKSTEWEIEHKAMNKILNGSQYEISSVLVRANVVDLKDYATNNFWLIHFSGHGTEGGKLIFEDTDRYASSMRKNDFIEWIEAMDNLHCLYLSACQSDELVAELEHKVDYVIGFKNKILNEDAIEFSKAFYESLVVYATVPFAFKDACRKLKRHKFKGDVKPVFTSKYAHIMDAILEGKTTELRLKYNRQQDVLTEIDLLEQDVNRTRLEVNTKNEAEKEVFLQCLREAPYPREAVWFADNQEDLASRLSATILDGKTEYEQIFFAKDLKTTFYFLKASILTYEHKEFTKADLKAARMSISPVNKSFYRQAYEMLPTLVPTCYSSEFVVYLRANCNYIKGLL